MPKAQIFPYSLCLRSRSTKKIFIVTHPVILCRQEIQPPPPLVAGGSSTFVWLALASSFFPCTDTFPAAAVATAAGLDVFAGSALGVSALTAVAAVAL